MKPKEFYEIMLDFVEEEKRWRSLKVGDVIYDEQPRGFENDYHKMIIDEINIEEREVKAHDVEGNHKATLSYFLTEEEFDKTKNSWNRKEVIKLLKKGISEAVSDRNQFVTGIAPRNLSDGLFNKWVNKNLK